MREQLTRSTPNAPDAAPRKDAERLRKQLSFIVAVLIALLLAPLIWRLVEFAIASNKGLDLTDEGLYLMAADPPSPQASWGFPWGWHTRPLFALVNYDIATFRTLGGVLLLTAAAFFGWATTRYAFTLFNRPLPLHRGTHIWYVAAIVTASSGALLYYAGLLRAPSYNWVNLMGIFIASAAWIMLVAHTGVQSRRKPKLAPWVWVSISAFGLAFTIPAKPSTAPCCFLRA